MAALALALISNVTFARGHSTKTSQNIVLRHRLDSIVNLYKGDIGVALMDIESKDTLTINNAHHYPMQSTYKFPLAIYILRQVTLAKLSLKQKVHISKEELHPKTWSPLREKYPEGNIDLTLGELIDYTVRKSDNNTCDILFRLAGGTKNVDQYVHNSSFKQIAIAATEAEMAAAWDVQYTNWTEPYTMVSLLEFFYNMHYNSSASYTQGFLMKIMLASENSPKRIKGLLPQGTVVAHKTGTSNTNEKGITAAVNDIGIITLPNGKHLAIAVYVSNTTETNETSERIIAEIAKASFDYFAHKN
jgi:beta-lactamase class A